MGGEPAQYDVILKAELEHLQRLMGGKAIADQEPGSVASTSLGLRVEYMLDPIQIDGAVRVSLFRAGKVPSRGGMGGPVTTMCGGRPDNQGIERPTVGRDAFHSGD
jgi:hypothetical protein